MKTLQLDDGVVHIVRSAKEAEELKRTKNGEHFTWHFHGSPEHVRAIHRSVQFFGKANLVWFQDS